MAQIKKVDQGLIVSKALLRKSGIRPRKRLGQNFLEDPAVIEKIITHAGFDKKRCGYRDRPGFRCINDPDPSLHLSCGGYRKRSIIDNHIKRKVVRKKKRKR